MDYRLKNGEKFVIDRDEYGEFGKININERLGYIYAAPLRIINPDTSLYDFSNAAVGDLIDEGFLLADDGGSGRDLTYGFFGALLDDDMFFVFDINTKKICYFVWEDNSHADDNYNVIIKDILATDENTVMKYIEPYSDGYRVRDITFNRDMEILSMSTHRVIKNPISSPTVPTNFVGEINPEYYYKNDVLPINGGTLNLHYNEGDCTPFSNFSNHRLYPVKGKFKWAQNASISLPTGMVNNATNLTANTVYEYTIFDNIFSVKEVPAS